MVPLIERGKQSERERLRDKESARQSGIGVESCSKLRLRQFVVRLKIMFHELTVNR